MTVQEAWWGQQLSWLRASEQSCAPSPPWVPAGPVCAAREIVGGPGGAADGTSSLVASGPPFPLDLWGTRAATTPCLGFATRR